MGKVRVNITVEKKNLDKAKKKLSLFGGKLSTLFDAYLRDFVESMDDQIGIKNKELLKRIELLESKVEKLNK
tara:strand:+ start:590 stop:805 length:216 start_codon:yes stop_codon:yes gene_type:complete